MTTTRKSLDLKDAVSDNDRLWPEYLTIACAILMLIAFTTLPFMTVWQNSYSGLQLLLNADAILHETVYPFFAGSPQMVNALLSYTGVFQPPEFSNLVLMPLAILMAAVFATIGIYRHDERQNMALGILLSGFTIIIYCLIFIAQPQYMPIINLTQIGFWSVFALAFGLLLQVFLPRKGVEFFTARWWLVALIMLWLLVVINIPFSLDYRRIYAELSQGILLTIYLAVASYVIAIVIGLITGIIRANPPQPPSKGMSAAQVLYRWFQTGVYNAVSFYVEFMRGIPPLVFLLIAGFIIVPAVRDVINMQIVPFLRTVLNDPNIEELVWRGRDPGTAIAGLALVYGAFLSEVFRAGIQGVPKGQVEAAKSLGMSYFQVMRYIVVPQAIRAMLPPLGNDFVAMIKDTSLVTILGVNEITQLARKWSGSTFMYLETYLVLSLIYLTMTVTGSILVQLMERFLRKHDR